ncbi:MAG: hypothetical protein HUJ91_07050, partial [Bacteroidales bacterium]|nr:hypothetical protein [Bacteroidales bacterium]
MEKLDFSHLRGGISCKAVYVTSAISAFDSCSLNVIELETKKEALFMTSDLSNFFEESCIYYLPAQSDGKSTQSVKSATLKVQRTSAISAIQQFENQNIPRNFKECVKKANCILSKDIANIQLNSLNRPVIIVTYTDSLKEKILQKSKTSASIITLSKGAEISHDTIRDTLFSSNFTKVDFVSMPGEFAVRGSIIDIFSYSDNNPYRIDFFGDEIESISKFDSNSQRTIEKVEKVDIYPNLFENHESEDYVDISEILPESCIWWNLRNDLQYNNERENDYIPQPVFNKNFDILCSDIERKEEEGYKIHILSQQLNQRMRLKQILEEKMGRSSVEFISLSLHEGYINNIDKQCYYTDHQIFERYHKIKESREVKSSERLTINDLTSFHIGDYVVHIDHGVGQFGGLVRTEIGGKMQEAVKLIYKDGDVIFVSIHGIHRISRYKS